MKKRGNLPVTRPTHRGSGIALIVERATPKPTLICINDNNCNKANGGCLQHVGYYIPMSVFVALILD